MNFHDCLQEAIKLDCGMRCKHLGVTGYLSWRDVLKYIGEAEKDLSEKLVCNGFWELESESNFEKPEVFQIELISNACHRELGDIDVNINTYEYLVNKYGEDLANKLLFVHHRDFFNNTNVYRIKNANDESIRFNPYLIDMIKTLDLDEFAIKKAQSLDIETYDNLETDINLKFY